MASIEIWRQNHKYNTNIIVISLAGTKIIEIFHNKLFSTRRNLLAQSCPSFSVTSGCHNQNCFVCSSDDPLGNDLGTMHAMVLTLDNHCLGQSSID
jgi:hypothetical protein